MAILPEGRADLATGLRQLIGGEIANDEFADRWYTRYEECPDAAVARIAEFGDGLSSDRLFAIRPADATPCNSGTCRARPFGSWEEPTHSR